MFWKNYFFHCAFTRYEAGLSIDEIWSYQVHSTGDDDGAQDVAVLNGESKPQSTAAHEEETVVFDGSAESSTVPGNNEVAHAGFQDMEKVMAADAADVDAGGATDASLGQSDGSPNNGFELLDESDDGGVADPELDELEAEILRELED